MNFYLKIGKRTLDHLLAVTGLILFFPLELLIAIAVKVDSFGPIFFCQQRAGFHGRVFMLYKFRTMTDARDSEGNLLPPAERITRVGRFLRSTSLDELPQLWNVLKGDMSLIGPRPLLVDYLPLYTKEEYRRHEVLPGITGWAQVQGRNALSWKEKFILDVWYVNHLSFWLDMKILFLTVWRIVKREGVSPDDDDIMPRFTGTQSSE